MVELLFTITRLSTVLRACALIVLVGAIVPGSAAIDAWAQRSSAAPDPVDSPPIRFQRLTLEDGLSQGHIYDIIQDRRGYMWFATESGLNRYDGHEFKVYNSAPFSESALPDGTVNGLYEDSEGQIWVATRFGGLNRLNPLTNKVTRFQHEPGISGSLLPGSVNAVVKDLLGGLWVGTDNGLSHMTPDRPGHFTHYRHNVADSTSLSNNQVRSLRVDAQGRLWVATANGLNRMDLDTPGRFQRYLYGPMGADSTRTNRGYALHHQYVSSQQPGVVWVGSEYGLIRFEPATGQSERFLPNPAGPPEANTIVTVTADPASEQGLWVATQNQGLARFHADTETFVRYQSAPERRHGLLDLASNYVYTSREGVVWVGTSGAGINAFYPRTTNVSHYRAQTTEVEGGEAESQKSQRGALLRNPDVWGLGVTQDGALWASTSGGYLHRINSQTQDVRVWRADPDKALNSARPAGTAYDFAEHEDGTLWIGTGRSLDRYDPETEQFRHYRHDASDSTSISNHNINVLKHDREGILWVGTFDGLNRYDPETDTFRRYRHNRSDPDGNDWVGYVLEDQAGRLWVATEQGVCQFDRDAEAFVRHFHHDPQDASTLTKGRFGWIHERPQEPGVLWVSSLDGGGFDRLDIERGAVTHYTTETASLPDNTVYAILEGGDGQLWLSTNHGLARFDPEATPPQRPVLRFGLESGLQGLEFNQHAAVQHNGHLYFGGVNGINAFRVGVLEGNSVRPRIVLAQLRVANKRLDVGPDSPLQRPLAETEAVELEYDQNQLTIAYTALHFKNPQRNRYRYRLEGYDTEWVEAGGRREATYTNLPPGAYTFHVQASNADGVWNENGPSLQIQIAPPWWRTGLAYGLYALAVVGGLGGVFYMQRRRQRRLEDAVEERTQQVRSQNRQLAEQATRLEELDAMKRRFFANISHEFRTPLTLLLGPTHDALQDDRPLAPDQVQLVHRNGKRLQTLINQLLDLSALDDGGLVPDAQWHEIAPLVQATTTIFAPLAERNQLTLTTHVPEKALVAHVDAQHLQAALKNLVANAIKYTPPGGGVDVTLSVNTSSDETAQQRAQIAVSDTGPGIPKKDQEHLFDRFQRVGSTAARAQEGSGIGLSLARELIEINGGQIRVESPSSGGSTFLIVLPVETERPAVGHPTPERGEKAEQDRASGVRLQSDFQGDFSVPDASAASGNAHTNGAQGPVVLIVDDNADVRRYVRSVLEGGEMLGAPCTVIEAGNGAAGLKTARKQLPDCIVADVMMPKMDGFEMGKALMNDPMTAGIPLLYLTARATVDDEVDGLAIGADAYLVKPFESRTLHARVQNLIRKRLRLRELHQASNSPDTGEAEEADEAPSDTKSKFVSQVRQAIRENLSDPNFGVNELADAVSVSRSHLYRRIKDEFSQTPSTLLRAERLKRARQLLDQKEGNVSEVAYAVGFSSLSHFSTVFRKQYNQPPSEVMMASG